MTNDGFIEWNGGVMPVPESTKIRVRYESGDEVECLAGDGCSNRWSHVSIKDCNNIVAYKILEKITPEDFGAVADPKGHPNASILMEIAKEAAVNKEYWKEFEIKAHDGCWYPLAGAEISLGNFIDNPIRRKPRTIRIGKYDVKKPVHLIAQKGCVSVFVETEEDAELMLKALQELLGERV